LLHRIRDQEEEYWRQCAGAPKAWITLASGQRMWASRFGSLTSIRFPYAEAPVVTDVGADRLSVRQREVINTVLGLITGPAQEARSSQEAPLTTGPLDLAQLGFRFEPVRAQALTAAGCGPGLWHTFLWVL